MVATAEILDYLPREHAGYERLVNIERDILAVVCRYQHESGRWFQVLDRVEDERNWLENSASCLIVAAIAKCIRMGILPEDYVANVKRGLVGVLDTVRVDDGVVILPEICVGTCIDSGTAEHYFSRATTANDMHGTGTFLMMLAEAGMLLD